MILFLELYQHRGEDRVVAVNTPKAVDDVITSVKYTNNEGGLLNWSLGTMGDFSN